MASVNRGLLNISWKPTLQFVRYRKVNVQKPFPPHFERATVEHVCKPYFAKPKLKDPTVPLHETCQVGVKYFQKDQVDNPYVTLLGKDLLNWFNHSKLIAFFHRNPMNSDEIFEIRLMLKKLQMRYKVHGREVISKTVTGTKYEPVLGFYESDTSVAYGPEPNVKGLLKGLKKTPKLILLGAVVEDRLMSRAELEYYGSLPDLQTARAGLVSVLNSTAQGVVRSLNHHQSQLVQHLRSHIDNESKNTSS